MKKIKVTPVLLLWSILIIGYILDLCNGVWTPFSGVFMIAFIIIMCLAIFYDRFFVAYFRLRDVWIAEFIFILLAVLFALKVGLFSE